MKAEIVAIGTELLLGEITDTNTPYIARELALLGIDLYYVSTVGDNYDRLIDVLRVAFERSDIVFTTGGLGPSQGDVTRLAVAGLFGEEMYEVPELKQQLIEMFDKRGLETTPNNFKQATLIPSAEVILNPRGTAPGWWAERNGHVIVCMPGPPAEMHVMWQSGVLPRLKARTESVILSRTLKTAGMSESKMDMLLKPYSSSTNPTVATYAKNDGIHIRITAKAKGEKEAAELIAGREAEVRGIFGDAVWGTDTDTHEGIIGKLLIEKGLTLALVESFGNPILIDKIVALPDSDRFFRGGIVTGSDAARIALGVEKNLIETGDSMKVAEQMAALVREKLNADVGLALHGEIPQDPNDSSHLVMAVNSESTGNHVNEYTQESFRLRARAGQYILSELGRILR